VKRQSTTDNGTVAVTDNGTALLPNLPVDLVSETPASVTNISIPLPVAAEPEPSALEKRMKKLEERMDSQLNTLFQMTERIFNIEKACAANPEIPVYLQVTDEQKAALLRPLPSEAISAPSSETHGLSSIKPIYVGERFSEVFGLCGLGWILRSEVVSVLPKDSASKKGDMVVVKAYVDIPAYNIHLESYGGNNNRDAGDAYKGAVSDALTKMASFLGIGADVYKGRGSAPSKEYEQQQQLAEAEQMAEPPVAAPAPPPPPPPPPPVAEKTDEKSDNRTVGVTCEDCNQLVSGLITGQGTFAAEQILDRSQSRYKLNLCAQCLRVRRAKAELAGGGRVN